MVARRFEGVEIAVEVPTFMGVVVVSFIFWSVLVVVSADTRDEQQKTLGSLKNPD